VRLDPSDTLRNIVTTGIALETLIGKRFRVGERHLPRSAPVRAVHQLGEVPAPPRRHQSLRPRSGLRADILETGMVRRGVYGQRDLLPVRTSWLFPRGARSGVRSFMSQ